MLDPPKQANLIDNEVEFSICTLVTDMKMYSEMLDSFKQKGFSEPHTEYLYLDNCTKNNFNGYDGVNLFLNRAKGKYIIICHQDLLLLYDDIETLREKITELDTYDKNWGLAGNAGGDNDGNIKLRLTDPYRTNGSQGPFPAAVTALDENFILVKSSANLSVSNDLDGFNLYGADICVLANIRGYNAYVINFHLHHLSGNSIENPNIKHDVKDSTDAFLAKYQRALRIRKITSTSAKVIISGTVFLKVVVTVYLFSSRPYSALYFLVYLGSA